MRLDQPNSVRAEMARRGILPTQLRPYEDPERGHVDPYHDAETRTLIVGFLAQLNALLIEAHNDQAKAAAEHRPSGREDRA